MVSAEWCSLAEDSSVRDEERQHHHGRESAHDNPHDSVIHTVGYPGHPAGQSWMLKLMPQGEPVLRGRWQDCTESSTKNASSSNVTPALGAGTASCLSPCQNDLSIKESWVLQRSLIRCWVEIPELLALESLWEAVQVGEDWIHSSPEEKPGWNQTPGWCAWGVQCSGSVQPDGPELQGLEKDFGNNMFWGSNKVTGETKMYFSNLSCHLMLGWAINIF